MPSYAPRDRLQFRGEIHESLVISAQHALEEPVIVQRAFEARKSSEGVPFRAVVGQHERQRQGLVLGLAVARATTVGKTARKKKKFLRFGKNRKIRKAKEKEVKLETNLKKTKGHHDRLLNKADAVLDRIERGNEMGQRLQQILQQFQKPPAEGGE